MNTVMIKLATFLFMFAIPNLSFAKETIVLGDKKSKEAIEIVVMKFKDNVSFDDQKKSMETLSKIVSSFKGFVSREYYYSSENKRWIDFVIWESLELAKKASAEAMKNPTAGEIFSKIDQPDMIFSHYERLSR